MNRGTKHLSQKSASTKEEKQPTKKELLKERKRLESAKTELEAKRRRIEKGWYKRDEKFTDPTTGTQTTLTKENVSHALNACEGKLMTYSQARGMRKSPALAAINIIFTLLVLGGLGFAGWTYIGMEGITGFVVAGMDELSTLNPITATANALTASHDEPASDAPKPVPSLQLSLPLPNAQLTPIPLEEKSIRTDNHPPTFSGPEPLSIEGELLLDMREYVSDQDNDALTFIATQPHGTMVTVKDSKILISGVQEGSATITFIASDGDMLTRKEVPITFRPAQ